MSDKKFDQLTIFDGMDESQLALLRAYFVNCHCGENETIFEQGTPAEYLYIVIEGEVTVHFKPDDGPSLVVIPRVTAWE
jgi:CRP-like cAMP-binding protein